MKQYALITVLVATLILTGCGQRSPRDPYSLVATGASPESFAVLKCSDTSFGADANIWMHFSVATQEIATVIASGQYVTNSSPTSFAGMYPPEWWEEDEWPSCMVYYEWKRYHRSHKDILQEQKILWISKKTGDAYFARATF